MAFLAYNVCCVINTPSENILVFYFSQTFLSHSLQKSKRKKHHQHCLILSPDLRKADFLSPPPPLFITPTFDTFFSISYPPFSWCVFAHPPIFQPNARGTD
ncbi:unnamed protein product [Phytomonas sp. EM1]|nr:unnamed protein product [Phytomonas sp. EM1]|eukprot:CCW64142.1 unnamed protein product [Phytomonas sp. isolate EM1]